MRTSHLVIMILLFNLTSTLYSQEAAFKYLGKNMSDTTFLEKVNGELFTVVLKTWNDSIIGTLYMYPSDSASNERLESKEAFTNFKKHIETTNQDTLFPVKTWRSEVIETYSMNALVADYTLYLFESENELFKFYLSINPSLDPLTGRFVVPCPNCKPEDLATYF